MADLKTTKEITAELEKQRALRDDGRQSDATREARAQRIADLEKQLSDTLSEQIKARKIFNKLSADANKIEKDTSQSLISRLQSLAKGNVQAIFTNKAAEKQKSLQSDIAADAKARADQLAKEAKAGTMGNESFTQTLSLVDRIKSGLVEREDIDNEILSINERGRDIARGMSEELKKLADDKKREGELGVQAKETTEAQAKALATVGGIFTFLLSTANKFAATVDKIGQTFGSLNVLGKDVTKNLLDSSVEATKLGGSIDDVAAITNTLASDFGMTLEEASKLSVKVFDTSKALGLSADESANLFGVLTQTANLSAVQAEKLAEGTFQLARQAGVAPSAVLRDIAGSAETIALFTKDGGDNIGEAAVQARRLGLTLDTTAKIAEGLLDFEGSITKEVEASVLIGRQLNLQKARELALNNDIAGATQEVVKQLGSEEELNNLNLIQRKALADSIGVSVNELSKLVGQSDKLNLSGALAAGNFEDLLGEEGISNITKLTQSFAALGATLTNSLGPILNVVAKGLNFFGSILEFVVSNLEKIGALAPIIAGGLTFIATKSIATAVAKKKEAVFSGLASAFKLPFPVNLAAGAATLAAVGALIAQGEAVNDFHSGPGGITTMMGPAGVFSLNPKDSVLATTNPIPVNDARINTTTQGVTTGVNVAVAGKISGRDLVFFQEQGAEFTGSPGDGLM